MVDEIKKTIRSEIILDADKAIADAKAFDRVVKQLKNDLRALQGEGVSLGAAMDTIADSESTAKVKSRALSQAVKEVRQETKETEKGVLDFGNAAQRVFRSIVGFIVLNVLRRLLDLYGELTQAGKEFADSIVDISVAVRKLQRAGEEITFKEVAEEVQRLREQFGLFTTKDLNAGISSLLNLGQQLNLTKQQMFDIAEATAVAATVTGVEYDTAINRVTRALSTGYTKGLNELELAISEASIKEEAYRLGLAETGEELDRNTKAQAIYSLIIKETNKLNEDAAAIQETLVGSVVAEEKSLEQLRDEIGARLLPGKLALLKVVNQVLQAFFAVAEFMRSVSIPVNTALGAVVIVVSKAFETLRAAITGTLDELAPFNERVREALNTWRAFLEGFAAPVDELDLALGDLPQGLSDAADGIESGGNEVDDALKDLFIKIRENLIDGDEQIEKAGRQLFDKLVDISRKLVQALQQLDAKLAFDRAKIWRDFNDKVSDINNKARDREIDAERKFQDRLRSLRAKFLMDLEDAVRERDARQIIRLIRQFNLQKDELERQRDSERKEIDLERQRELRDLQQQRDRRLRELDLEFAFRRQKLLEQAQFDREQAQLDNERKLREIQIATQQRNEELIRRYADEHAITQEFAEGIAKLLNNYFGPDGRIEDIYEYFLVLTAAVFESLGESVSQLNSLSKLGNFAKVNPASAEANAGGFAEGGTLVAKRPTVAVFGEAGPERVDFTPLTRPGRDVGRVFGGSLAGSSQGQGKIGLLISLTPGLKAEIVGNTLGQMADIIVDTNRQRL